MTEFLLGAAVIVLATVAVGLARVLGGPGDADRMMAAVLLGTGGVAALLLVGAVYPESAVVNVALTLSLLAAFAAVVFYKSAVADGEARGLSEGEADPSERAHEHDS